MIDAAALRPGYDTRHREGFFAEFYADGSLARFGFYARGEPRGWILTLAADGSSARVEKTTVARYPEEGEAEPLNAPQEQQLFHEELEEWARTWIDEIYRDADHRQRCSFCQKPSDQVARLIAGPTSYICNECVALCTEILGESAAGPSDSAAT